MFGFFKHKKEKDSPAPQLIVHTEKTYEKKLPTISDECITLSVNELLDGKYTYAQLLLENFFYCFYSELDDLDIDELKYLNVSKYGIRNIIIMCMIL